jgi:hypothetical protein
MLRPLDVVVLLKLHLLGSPAIGQMRLAGLLGVSSRSVNTALKHGEEGRLYDPVRRAVNVTALEEALIHGIRYFMPPERGGMTRGVPTAWAAPPLVGLLAATNEPPPVWPHPEGKVRGLAFLPLHDSVPSAAEKDPKLYEALALVDAIRDGRARESRLAADELRKLLRHS